MADTHAEKQNYPDIVGISKFGAISEDKKSLDQVTTEYNSYFDKSKPNANAEERKANYTTVVNHYYDLATDFYEYGWGQSFHFAARDEGQTFDESVAEHERVLARHLDLKPGQKALDVGCGVGGPMREIARFTGASIVGINNNDYQLERLKQHNERAGLGDTCSGVKGDFMKMPFEDNTFDAVYAFEATCHAPERSGVYSEMMRVLKPGGKFAIYDWCMTEKYDANSEQHNQIKHDIEVGDALPPILTIKECLAEAKKAGVIIKTVEDLAIMAPGKIPWYATLQGSFSLSGFRMTSIGRTLTHSMCRVLEFIGFAPKGTVAASQVLMTAADSLVLGGETEIFTPMLLIAGEKAN